MGFELGQGPRAAPHALAAQADLDDIFGTAADYTPAVPVSPHEVPIRRHMLRVGLTLALSALFVGLLAHRLAEVDFAATARAVSLVSISAWAAAFAFTAAAFCAVGQYDVVLHRHFETGVDARAARAAGISAIAVSQTIGLGVVTGAVLRWRMLPDQSFWLASRITVAVAASFLAGWAVVTALAVIAADLGGYSAIAWAVLTAAAALVMLCLFAPPAPFRWPNLPTISALVLLCAVDTLAAAGALYVLLPSDLSLSLLSLLPAFLLAYGAGLLSGTPGGIGAFELSLMALLPHTSEAPLLAAVLCWRLAYFAVPALLGAAVAIRGPRTRSRGQTTRLQRKVPDCAGAQFHHLPAEYGLLTQGEHRFLSSDTSGWMVAKRGHVLVGLLDPVVERSIGFSYVEPIKLIKNTAKSTGRLPAMYKTSGRTAATARILGWRAIRIAREAVIAPASFDLNSPARAALRRKLRRAGSAGVTVRRVNHDQLSIWRLAQIAQSWALAHGGERGFSMGRFTAEYICKQRVYAAQVDGVILGFVSFHTNADEWALDVMRSENTLPDGATHALIAAAICDAATLNVARVSLAAVPETAFTSCGGARILHRLMPLARLFRLDAGLGLRQFKEVFAPTWRARYICAPNWPTLLLASASIARAVAFPRKLPIQAHSVSKNDFAHDNRFDLPAAIWHAKASKSAK